MVRIRNGEICYWPNLGYGQFGAKITMGDAPTLDHPERFDPARVQLADIDGSGPADLIYVGPDAVRIFMNLSGNRFGPEQALTQLAGVDGARTVQVVDLLGDGTACLVWSSSLLGDRGQALRYVRLMPGGKPHLLATIVNNLGRETRLTYASSTKYYLRPPTCYPQQTRTPEATIGSAAAALPARHRRQAHGDLERMEVAFVELDRRELEVTKHVSLQRLDPAALLALKTLGTCDFSLPEVLFDLDFPGHYLRRIKGVTMSMPSVTGPYEGMNATLALTRSEVRMDPSPTDPGDYRLAPRVPERWSERVALSSGQQDGGLFTFDVRDAKYLPFEHRGVISDWSLELAGAEGTPARPQFDWNSISDVVFHVRYTARYESGLKAAARAAVPVSLEAMYGASLPLQLGLSFRERAPTQWAAFLRAVMSPTVPTVLRMTFPPTRLPYMIAAMSPKVKAIRVVFWCASGSPATASVVKVGIDTSVTAPAHTASSPLTPGPGGQPTATFDYQPALGPTVPMPSPGATQELAVQLTGLSGVLFPTNIVDPKKLLDIVVVLDLDFGDFAP